jgi:outer membrane usher protein
METGRAFASGGAELLLRARRGIVGLSGALSRSRGDAGAAGILSYQSSAPRLTYGATVGLQSPRYSTLSLTADGDRALLSASASVAAATGRQSSIGVSFGLQRDRDNGPQSLWQVSRWMTISQNATLQISAQRTHGSAGSAFGISTALNLLPRSGTNASLIAGSSAGLTQTTLQVSHIASSQTPAFGYDAAISAGGASPSLYASADYRNTTGDYTADVSLGAGSRNLSFNAAGGIVTFGRRAFFTQSVDDSYALVDANGLAGVRVVANNVEAGRTGPSGFLVVPRLGSYFDNTISLASSDIPMNYNIDRATQHVTPSYRSGQIVRFSNERVHALAGRLIVRRGEHESVPAYGLLEIRRNALAIAHSDIGQNGEFYLENIAPGVYEATIRYRDGDCAFTFSVPAGAAVIEKLPVQVCSQEVRH